MKIIKIYYRALKVIFKLRYFKNFLHNLTKHQIEQLKKNALSDSNFELAAFLQYYVIFKYNSKR